MSHLPAIRKPRERLWEHGPTSLDLEELVTVVLGSGSATHEVRSLSKRVVNALLQGQTSAHELATIPGIGKAKAALLTAAFELPTALAKCQNHAALTTPEHIYAACADLLYLSQEHLVVFYLSARNQPLRRETVTIGLATASLIHPREVFRPAISHNATAIALAHNHPSGDSSPSGADREATKRIALAGKQLGIELMDHVICAAQGFYSLRLSEPELFS